MNQVFNNKDVTESYFQNFPKARTRHPQHNVQCNTTCAVPIHKTQRHTEYSCIEHMNNILAGIRQYSEIEKCVVIKKKPAWVVYTSKVSACNKLIIILFL